MTRCIWKEDSDYGGGPWETSCGKEFTFTDEDGPDENGFKFCCWCGKMIKAEYFSDPYEDGVHEDCHVCRGTGIGQHGDPDTSKCVKCGGRGYFLKEE